MTTEHLFITVGVVVGLLWMGLCLFIAWPSIEQWRRDRGDWCHACRQLKQRGCYMGRTFECDDCYEQRW
jgi:hypothetical protein